MVFKRLNTSKESRHSLLERKCNKKETEMRELHIQDEEPDEMEGEDDNDDVYVSLKYINEQSEREILKSNTHLNNTDLPSSTPCLLPSPNIKTQLTKSSSVDLIKIPDSINLRISSEVKI